MTRFATGLLALLHFKASVWHERQARRWAMRNLVSRGVFVSPWPKPARDGSATMIAGALVVSIAIMGIYIAMVLRAVP